MKQLKLYKVSGNLVTFVAAVSKEEALEVALQQGCWKGYDEESNWNSCDEPKVVRLSENSKSVTKEEVFGQVYVHPKYNTGTVGVSYLDVLRGELSVEANIEDIRASIHKLREELALLEKKATESRVHRELFTK